MIGEASCSCQFTDVQLVLIPRGLYFCNTLESRSHVQRNKGVSVLRYCWTNKASASLNRYGSKYNFTVSRLINSNLRMVSYFFSNKLRLRADICLKRNETGLSKHNEPRAISQGVNFLFEYNCSKIPCSFFLLPRSYLGRLCHTSWRDKSMYRDQVNN